MPRQEFYKFSTPESVSDWIKIHYTQEDLDSIDKELHNSESALSEYRGNYSKVINDYVRKGQENNQKTYDIVKMQEFLTSRIIDDNIEVKTEQINEDSQHIQEAFVTGLPDWDLEPLYEPIKRGNKT